MAHTTCGSEKNRRRKAPASEVWAWAWAGTVFFLENVHEIAPLLSKLYADVLAKGHMTPSMCHAILSPINKNKGSKEDRAMNRPISVTTIPYGSVFSRVCGDMAQPFLTR